MRTTKEILRDIAQFQPVDGVWLPLDHLLIELWSVGPPPSESLPILFGVFERFPENDGAGVFWSLVHSIESLPYNYEPQLRESYNRVQSEMANVMLIRLANSAKGD